jgi:hypothetical protein
MSHHDEPLVAVLRTNGGYDIYMAGVLVMTYMHNEHGDGGVWIRRVVKSADMQRLKDAQVRIPKDDCRVLVY